MEFTGAFELDGVSPDEAWIVLSDPVTVRDALKGCRYITPIDDEDFSFDDYEADDDLETLPEADPEAVAERAFEEGVTYAALMQVGVGSVKPRFEAQITIEERDREAHRMVATGGGDSSGSTFTMESSMEISETDDGSVVEWSSEADVSGRIAQMGGRIIDPVANKLVNNFFNEIQQQMAGSEAHGNDDDTNRLRNLL